MRFASWLRRAWPSATAILAVAIAGTQITGCVPAVVVAGAGATALVATDRRTTGAQVDDESIELKISTAALSKYGESIHVNVTSYNGIVILTGEIPSTEVRNDIVLPSSESITPDTFAMLLAIPGPVFVRSTSRGAPARCAPGSIAVATPSSHWN